MISVALAIPVTELNHEPGPLLVAEFIRHQSLVLF
jgi:hypothetical protein